MKHEVLESELALKNAISRMHKKSKLIIVGESDEVELLKENVELNDSSVEEIILNSKAINSEAWFSQRKEEIEDDWGVDLAENEGEWPEPLPPKQGFLLITDISTGNRLENVTCISVESDDSWALPAHLKYGGWNDCPNPEIHCAVWRCWEEKYGAKIIGISSDVIEAYVERPPQNRDEAMILARQQYLYCADIVEQGVGTVSNLAASLIDNSFWFFWWD